MRFRLISLLLFLMSAAEGGSQIFDSGSVGSDGPFILTTPGTVAFDSSIVASRSNFARGDVYHFTSIYIGAGVTVKLFSSKLNGPVFWLSSGPVEIDGVIDLNGDDGGISPSLPGAGGYPGGAVHQAAYIPEGLTANIFLVPLTGGLGGNGGKTQGGGAGGGAILIASSTSITVNGTIVANGGSSQDGSGGNGGAVRLVAPTIDGSGSLSAKGGQPGGADGRIRFEAFDHRYTGALNDTPVAQGKPFGVFLPPTPPPSIRMSVGGTVLEKPEFTINRPGASTVEIAIEAHYIPTGTVIQVEVFSDQGSSQTVEATPLAGTFELSRAVASVTLPRGKSRSQFRAVWKQPDITR